MGWHFVITEEMRGLGLTGNDLLVFALIFGFSQKGQGCFFGSVAYICETCGISRASAFRVLNDLVKKGFITKLETIVNGVKSVSYRVDEESLKMRLGVSKRDGGGLKMRPNNIDDININIERDKKREETFKKPSVEEIAEYCRKRGNDIDPEEFFAFYESKGWFVGKSKMKKWESAVITWEKSRAKRKIQTPRQTGKESAFEANLRVADSMFGTSLHSQVYQTKKENIDEQ